MELARTACDVTTRFKTATVNVQKAATCLSEASASIDGLQVDGKVPAQALRACSTIKSGHAAVTQHVAALQQCLLPCSAEIVRSTVSYLQLVSADHSRFVALVESGQLRQRCEYFAKALACAQEGYEALASDLLALRDTMNKTERKVHLDLQAAREHLDDKLTRREVARKAGPAAAGTAAGLAAGLVGLLVFPPLVLAAPLAGVWAAAEAEGSADDALWRAQRQLARTQDIRCYCEAAGKQLRHAMDLLAATRCVAYLAGFFSNLAASTDRASSTAERLEVRSAGAHRAASGALGTVLLRQIREVTAAGASFTAVVDRLTSSSSSSGLELKPAYQKVARVARQLKAQTWVGLPAGR